jgi:flagellar biogenesis protein FliO
LSDVCSGLLSFVGVVGLFALLFFFCKKLQSGNIVGVTSSKYMVVVDKVALGPSSSLAIVKIGGKYYLASVSGAGVTLHGNIEQSDLVEAQRRTVGLGKLRFRGKMSKGEL